LIAREKKSVPQAECPFGALYEAGKRPRMNQKKRENTSMVRRFKSPTAGGEQVGLKRKGIVCRLKCRNSDVEDKGPEGVIQVNFLIRTNSIGPDITVKLNRFLRSAFRGRDFRALYRIKTLPAPVLSACQQTATSASDVIWIQRGSPDKPLLNKQDHILGRFGMWRHVALVILIGMLTVMAGAATWPYRTVPVERSGVEQQIAQIEAGLRTGGSRYEDLQRLIDDLGRYEMRVRELQKNLLYELGIRNQEYDFIEQEIKAVMAEFGAERYIVPPDFVEQVIRFTKQLQGRDRDITARALSARKDLETVRRILEQENVPPDLVYMALVESDFLTDSVSVKGAAGLWQFMGITAREYGMVVNEKVDDRFDLYKSSRAAGRYLRNLILDFGSGSSVMLALAAYNSGPERVRRAIRSVRDPIEQRNFWYLYQTKALPKETRLYVPKVIAAIIVGRNPQHFGFSGEECVKADPVSLADAQAAR
jgi:soluble lytic murein transglycosylase-like protein